MSFFFFSTAALQLAPTIINTMIARHIVMHYSFFLSVSDYPLPFDNHHTQMCLDYKQQGVKKWEMAHTLPIYHAKGGLLQKRGSRIKDSQTRWEYSS